MEGYSSSSYGEAFADVYDDWYGDISDVDATVRLLVTLSAAAGSDLPIVELGVGTGRLAIPLATCVQPTPVVGIDSSAAMLARLSAKQPTVETGPRGDITEHPRGGVVALLGDMIADLPDGPLGVVFVAFNTFFNLATAERQQACFDAVSARLAPGGCFVIEAYVPDDPPLSGSHVEVKTIAADRVVLSVARYNGATSQAEGQFVEFTEAGGVRLRPWSIRYVQPTELDAMASTAGLVLRQRWETAAGVPYDQHSDRHVSVYSLA